VGEVRRNIYDFIFAQFASGHLILIKKNYPSKFGNIILNPNDKTQNPNKSINAKSVNSSYRS
jgi:hypothetical protein